MSVEAPSILKEDWTVQRPEGMLGDKHLCELRRRTASDLLDA